jgi:hypothetical protein
MIVDEFLLPPKRGAAIPTSPRRGLFFVPGILSQLEPRLPQGEAVRLKATLQKKDPTIA